MPEAICQYCRSTEQPVPQTHGAILRCALESLALRYQMVLGMLQQLTGSEIETVHIVGGGIQNGLLCQLTADACHRPVVAGPVEATAIGNLMVQLVSHGAVHSIPEARQIIQNSFDTENYLPDSSLDWGNAIQRFHALVAS